MNMAFLATGIFILQQEVHFILTGSKNKIALTRNPKLGAVQKEIDSPDYF